MFKIGHSKILILRWWFLHSQELTPSSVQGIAPRSSDRQHQLKYIRFILCCGNYFRDNTGIKHKLYNFVVVFTIVYRIEYL